MCTLSIKCHISQHSSFRCSNFLFTFLLIFNSLSLLSLLAGARGAAVGGLFSSASAHGGDLCRADTNQQRTRGRRGTESVLTENILRMLLSSSRVCALACARLARFLRPTATDAVCPAPTDCTEHTREATATTHPHSICSLSSSPLALLHHGRQEPRQEEGVDRRLHIHQEVQLGSDNTPTRNTPAHEKREGTCNDKHILTPVAPCRLCVSSPCVQ